MKPRVNKNIKYKTSICGIVFEITVDCQIEQKISVGRYPPTTTDNRESLGMKQRSLRRAVLALYIYNNFIQSSCQQQYTKVSIKPIVRTY